MRRKLLVLLVLGVLALIIFLFIVGVISGISRIQESSRTYTCLDGRIVDEADDCESILYKTNRTQPDSSDVRARGPMPTTLTGTTTLACDPEKCRLRNGVCIEDLCIQTTSTTSSIDPKIAELEKKIDHLEDMLMSTTTTTTTSTTSTTTIPKRVELKNGESIYIADAMLKVIDIHETLELKWFDCNYCESADLVKINVTVADRTITSRVALYYGCKEAKGEALTVEEFPGFSVELLDVDRTGDDDTAILKIKPL